MKIKISESIFEIRDVSVTRQQIHLVTTPEDECSQLIKAVSECTAIDIVDDTDTTIKTIEGAFVDPYIVDEPYAQTVVFARETIDSTKSLAELSEQITNLELALCEIYEAMEV